MAAIAVGCGANASEDVCSDSIVLQALSTTAYIAKGVAILGIERVMRSKGAC